MTAKKIQPKNPDTETKTTDTSPETGRKTMGFKWGGRKLARKTSQMHWSDAGIKYAVARLG